MTDLTLTLPPAMDDYIRERVEVGEFTDPSDYVRDLIRADQRALGELRALIDEGLDGADDERTVDQIFDEVVTRHRRSGWETAAAWIGQAAENEEEAAWRQF